MREIKFRAWEKNLKEIIPVDAVDFERKIINQNGPWRFFDEIELMRYTGLTDKNGREIYEGDLIACFNSGVSVVKYHYGTFGLELSVDNFYPFHEVYGEMEVIGNIYENPELLGDTQ